LEKSYTLQEYDFILKTLKDRKYQFVFFGEEKDKSSILLRHDIDFSIEATMKLAEIEKNNSILGTYFIQLSSVFYNPLTPTYSSVIREISNMGHKIALHFDPTIYPDYQEMDIPELVSNIKAEIKVLSNLVNQDIDVVSFHNPTKMVFNKDLYDYGLISTYGTKYFNSNKIKYIADSNMKWRDGYILDKAVNNQSIQFLVHPGHWDGNTKGLFFERIMKKAISNQINNAYEIMRDVNYFWNDHIDDYDKEHSFPVIFSIDKNDFRK